MKGITNSGSGGGGSSDIMVITASSGANGSISPAGDVQVIKGDDKTFTFTRIPDMVSMMFLLMVLP